MRQRQTQTENNHAQIGGRFGAQQVARFLCDAATGSPFIVTSRIPETYCIYDARTTKLVFSGSADGALEFLEAQR